MVSIHGFYFGGPGFESELGVRLIGVFAVFLLSFLANFWTVCLQIEKTFLFCDLSNSSFSNLFLFDAV